jgi:hypothetical protein
LQWNWRMEFYIGMSIISRKFCLCHDKIFTNYLILNKFNDVDLRQFSIQQVVIFRNQPLTLWKWQYIKYFVKENFSLFVF